MISFASLGGFSITDCVFIDIDCGPVTPILHGFTRYLTNTTYVSSEVMFSCSPTYRLNGVPKRMCLQSGVWSEESPRCEGILTSSLSHTYTIVNFN